jgi:hypothetical protein
MQKSHKNAGKMRFLHGCIQMQSGCKYFDADKILLWDKQILQDFLFDWTPIFFLI